MPQWGPLDLIFNMNNDIYIKILVHTHDHTRSLIVNFWKVLLTFIFNSLVTSTPIYTAKFSVPHPHFINETFIPKSLAQKNTA